MLCRPMIRLLLISFTLFVSSVETRSQDSAIPSVDSSPLVLKFGLYQSDKATTVFAQFKPVVDHLGKELTRRLKRPVTVKIKLSRTYDAAIQALVRGSVDFARFGPSSYITAKNRNKRIQLLAMELKKGRKRFEGVFVVSEKSPIRSLAELKNKRFAFGDRNSTIGRYLAQDVLQNAGIDSRSLGGYAYLGRHDLVAKAIEVGDYDAGSLKTSTYRKMNATGKLRVLASFENVTKPWIARSNLNRDVVKHLKESLVSLKDPAVLKALKVSGLQSTSDKEYEFVRDAMKRAKLFDKK